MPKKPPQAWPGEEPQHLSVHRLQLRALRNRKSPRPTVRSCTAEVLTLPPLPSRSPSSSRPEDPPPRAHRAFTARVHLPAGRQHGRPGHHYLRPGRRGRKPPQQWRPVRALAAGSVPRRRGASGSATALAGEHERLVLERASHPSPERPGREPAAPPVRQDVAWAPLRMCARPTLRVRGANRKPRSARLSADWSPWQPPPAQPRGSLVGGQPGEGALPPSCPGRRQVCGATWRCGGAQHVAGGEARGREGWSPANEPE